MWLIFGMAAIFFAVLNVIFTFKKKEAKWFRFLSLSFTILTLCTQYNDVCQWVINNHTSALLDVVPYMPKPLWALSILSILINSVSLFSK